MKLVIGNKNYSSWSLRPWLLLNAYGVDFVEIQESLSQDDIRSRLGIYSKSCKVPVLIDGKVTIWDSLAICEYVNEKYLNGKGWPISLESRAIARSISSEMHSGFNYLRSEMPMNCRLHKNLVLSALLKRDVERVKSIWSTYAAPDSCGDLRLFGSFNISDCFFAPVALRFKSYGVSLGGIAGDYQSSLLEHPLIIEWLAFAQQETEVVAENEMTI